MNSIISTSTNKVSALVRFTLGAALLTGSLMSNVYAETDQKNLHADWTELLEQNISPINKGHSTAVDMQPLKIKKANYKLTLIN